MVTNRTTLTIVLGVLLPLALSAACGDDDVESSTGGESLVDRPPGRALEGTNWVLAPDAPLGVAIESISVTAAFDNETVSGRSGCNRYDARFEVDGPALTMGPDIATTRMSCPPPETAVEAAYLDRLTRVAAYEIDQDAMVLTDDAGETVLRYMAVEGVDAIEGTWTVTSYYAGTSVTSVLGGVTLRADFGADAVTGETGCNSFNGPVRVDGTAIEIGPLSSTLTACPTEELSQQEASYLEALQLATSFEVAGDRLDLLREDGGYAVSFEAG